MAMKNSNKRQLITSMMSLGLSVTMLMGTTLAWFTDSSTTKLTQIKTGTLEVNLLDANKQLLKERSLNWVPNDNREQENILWEPGCKYYTEPFIVQNNSNVDIKWKISIADVEGDKELLDVIDIGIYEWDAEKGEIVQSDRDFNGIENQFDPGTGLQGNVTDFVVVATMDKDAGNQYQNKSLSDVYVTLEATQYASEYDSINNQYDAGAEYENINYKNVKSTVQEVRNSLTKGESVTLVNDMTITKNDESQSNGYGKTAIKITNKDSVIDGNGKTITATDSNGTWDSVIHATAGTIKNLKVEGGFRGISVQGLSSDLTIDNVIIDNVTYTIHSDTGGNGNNLIVKNSTLNGWTSYGSGSGTVSFTNCKFGEGGGYAYMRPYRSTTLTDCDFQKGFKLDATKTQDIVLENCKVNGVTITQQNITTLLGSNAANAQVK